MIMINKLIYLSHALNTETPTYGGLDRLEIKPIHSIDKGDVANTSSWKFTNNHIGTHLDTPYHFDAAGKQTLDYPADFWLFNKVSVVKIECNYGRLITIADFDKLDVDSDVELLLIDTDYERFRTLPKFHNDNPGFHSELANYLRAHFPKLRCIGFDSISLTSWNFIEEGIKSHHAFLGPLDNGEPILIIEDVTFSNLNSDDQLEWVLVSPLRIAEGNGGPITIFGKLI